jgi:hypothetical protein
VIFQEDSMPQDVDAIDMALAALQERINETPSTSDKNNLIAQYDRLFATYEQMVVDESHAASARVIAAAVKLKQVVDSGRTDPLAILSAPLAAAANELNAAMIERNGS